jgi:hypothetical protein
MADDMYTNTLAPHGEGIVRRGTHGVKCNFRPRGNLNRL